MRMAITSATTPSVWHLFEEPFVRNHSVLLREYEFSSTQKLCCVRWSTTIAITVQQHPFLPLELTDTTN